MSRKTGTAAPRKVRCAIYTRKSTDEGLEQEFNSLDAQRESGEAYVASQKGEGWVCLPIRYDDGGFSGGNLERPALQRLLQDIQAGKIDCVVVYKVDRLSRSLLDFARIVETFDTHGVSFIAVSQLINTSSSMGRLMLNVLLSFAQFEREIIGERIRDKLAAQKRKGKWTGGKPILGYDVDRSGPSPKLVVNAAEAAQVRQIFALYLQLGSLLPVVQELASRGWSNKAWRTKAGEPMGGREFDRGGLYMLLTNPLYAGLVRYKSEVHPGEHAAIVDPEVFRQVQAQLDQNRMYGGAGVRNMHGALLRGLLICRSCDCAMTHTFTTRGTRRYRYYKCTRAIQRGRDACQGRSLPAAEIEQAVVEEIRGIGDDAALRAEVFRQACALADQEHAETDRERRDLERQLARDHAEVRKLATRGQQVASTTARIAELQDRITRTEARLAELGLVAKGEPEVTAADVDAAFAQFDQVWETLSPREQAQLLALLIDRVEFDAEQERLLIRFHANVVTTLVQKAAA